MSKNKTVVFLVLIGFVLRLGLGLFSFSYLPTIPTGSEPQKAGYLFFDAFHRDSQAWELAASDAPLTDAFNEKQSSDQYGGLLWLLAFLYRYLTMGQHVVGATILLSSSIGAVGVYFVYLTALRFFSNRTALLTATFAAIYPESVLLGASQMREPFLITFVAMFLYGMTKIQDEDKKIAIALLGFSTIGLLVISPGIVLLALLILAGWLFFDSKNSAISIKKLIPFLLSGILLFAVALLLLTASWETLVAIKGGGPLGTLGNWARQTAVYNAYLLKQSSGIVQVMMEALPSGLAMPFITIYGLLQPVLPAVLFEPGELFWKTLGFFRSIGWYLALPFLMYFPFALNHVPEKTNKKQWGWLFFVTILWCSISALRGGGDQWDNPRYRVILLPVILFLVTLAITNARAAHPSVLKKILAVEVINLMVFCHWYSWRYAGFGYNLGIRNTILLSIILSAVVLFGDLFFSKRKSSTRL
jgi:hypothetical protein